MGCSQSTPIRSDTPSAGCDGSPSAPMTTSAATKNSNQSSIPMASTAAAASTTGTVPAAAAVPSSEGSTSQTSNDDVIATDIEKDTAQPLHQKSNATDETSAAAAVAARDDAPPAVVSPSFSSEGVHSESVPIEQSAVAADVAPAEGDEDSSSALGSKRDNANDECGDKSSEQCIVVTAAAAAVSEGADAAAEEEPKLLAAPVVEEEEDCNGQRLQNNGDDDDESMWEDMASSAGTSLAASRAGSPSPASPTSTSLNITKTFDGTVLIDNNPLVDGEEEGEASGNTNKNGSVSVPPAARSNRRSLSLSIGGAGGGDFSFKRAKSGSCASLCVERILIRAVRVGKGHVKTREKNNAADNSNAGGFYGIGGADDDNSVNGPSSPSGASRHTSGYYSNLKSGAPLRFKSTASVSRPLSGMGWTCRPNAPAATFMPSSALGAGVGRGMPFSQRMLRPMCYEISLVGADGTHTTTSRVVSGMAARLLRGATGCGNMGAAIAIQHAEEAMITNNTNNNGKQKEGEGAEAGAAGGSDMGALVIKNNYGVGYGFGMKKRKANSMLFR